MIQLDIGKIKHKLREFRRLEQQIRFGVEIKRQGILVWDSFFDLRDVCKDNVKYDLKKLVAMSREEYKNVINEYWAFVYNELFKEKEADTLLFDLPYDADENAIKKRFHELAKQCHPDTGGDAKQFNELMETYRKLNNKL